jgi:hypothetical protein
MTKKYRPANLMVQLLGTKINVAAVPQNSEQALAEFLAECRCFFPIWEEDNFASEEDAGALLEVLHLKWKEYLHHLNRERHA